jgi:hypothetical protein
MADLLKSIRDDDDDDGLDEDEFKTLENAGMISKASAKSKGNARRNNAKHIVFVVNEEQSMEHPPRIFNTRSWHSLGHNYKAPTNELDRELSQYEEPHANDLGWKSDARSAKGIKRKPLTKEVHDLEMEDGHEAKVNDRVRHRNEVDLNNTETSYPFAQRTFGTIRTRQADEICGTGARDAKASDGQG